MLENAKDADKGEAVSMGSIAIVGIVRDIEKSIEKDIVRISAAFSDFLEINWFLVESGSSDKSEEKLKNLSREIPNFKFVSISIRNDVSRTEKMADARNEYLRFLRSDNNLTKYKYVVMADFNNLNKKLTYGAVQTCFKRDDWDVVTANQSGRYYDAWALRHPLWSPNDCWEQHAFYRKYLRFPESAITFSMRSRMLRIPRNSEWIEVDSAFGGLAIYKSSVLKSQSVYSGVTPDGKRVCEHVPFHSALKLNGARIFINPALINARITDHSRRLSPLFTFLRICRYPLNFLMKNSKNA